MSVRKFVAMVAVAASALAGPGYADDAQKGIKVDAEFAGSITNSTVYMQLPEDTRNDIACADASVNGGGVNTDPLSVDAPDVDAEAAVACANSAAGAARGTDSPGSVTGYTSTGNCTFGGVLTPNNRLNIAYGGVAKSTGPQVPQLTVVTCTISNRLGNTDSISVASSGPVSAAADVVDPPWPVSPVVVCVSGFSIFGPTPVVVVDLPVTCDAILA